MYIDKDSFMCYSLSRKREGKMNIEIFTLASTKEGYEAPQEEFDRIAGHTAGICYLPSMDPNKLLSEPDERTKRRIALIKGSGHHSTFDHESRTYLISGLPKIIAMILNNQRFYTTSEKSARYTLMPLEGEEGELFNKWKEIFQNEIREQWQEKRPQWFDDRKVLKLAQENARYLTSVFTPTAMAYTVSYRQYNVLHSLLEDEMERLSKLDDNFSKRLSLAIEEFLTACDKQIPLLDQDLSANKKGRHLSFLDKRPVEEYFGDVYATSYMGSLAQFAQAQRHRTLTYGLIMPKDGEESFYVPPILKSKPELVTMWLADCNSLKNNYPQGLLVRINERGNTEDFLLKVQERNCSCAQLEIDQQTTETKINMYKELKAKNNDHAEELEPFLVGSRCMGGYKCDSPCGFPEGITGTRNI